MTDVLTQLRQSPQACIRYKIEAGVFGTDPASEKMRNLREEIRQSSLVQALLSERQPGGTIPFHPYQKWHGAHWVLACLADLGYPAGDESLLPLREQVYDWLLSVQHARSIKTIQGRTRRCASMESNAAFALMLLGLADERTEELLRRLVGWQWPDGGWNCDKHPEAHVSSFHESLIPLRALALHARLSGAESSKQAAARAAELFLRRELFKRLADGSVISEDFIQLHYPCYWHYDLLFALKVMAEAGFLADPRCNAGLDLLESKQLPGGGFRAEGKFYRMALQVSSGTSRVNWGAVGPGKMNEFVTADALFVLRCAGRLRV